MKFDIIKGYGDEFIEMIKPHCTRIETAGSIRRKAADCKDIEIVCIPVSYKLENFLFTLKHKGIIWYTKNGRLYKQIKWKSCTIDLFIANEKNFGWIYFIRTGPKEWNIRAIARLKKFNVHSDNGYLRSSAGNIIETPQEQDIFDLLQCNPVEPERRH